MKKQLTYLFLILTILFSVNGMKAQNKDRELAPADATSVKKPNIVKLPTQNQTSTTIKVEGPGALYFARLNDGLGFWVINEGRAKPVGTVKFVQGKRMPNSYIVVLARGIKAIFYEDNLPLDYISQMSFRGKLENKNCPSCTVIMPLAIETSVEKRDVKFYEQILAFENKLKTKAESYETIGNQIETLVQKSN